MRRRALFVAVCAFGLVGVTGPVAALAASSTGSLPDGETRPVIVSAALAPPGRDDRILEAALEVDAYDNDGVVRYEYRWNAATFGSIHSTDARHPTVSYRDVSPSSRYALEVRAVDTGGWRSPWTTAWLGTTPPPPQVIVMGDSVASGYSKRWFTGRATCRDDALSYGATLRSALADTLPARWAPRYTNIAWPGADLRAVIAGGADACGDRHPSQVEAARDLADPSTWNVIVVTAGINSTNWVDVVAGLTRDTAVSITDRGDAAACRRAVGERWDLDRRRAGIIGNVEAVVDGLAETNADVFWTGYYGIDRTRLAPAWMPIGAECVQEMALALDDLHRTLRRGVAGRATWVEVDVATVSTQPWAGWPHPDADGHRTLGTIIARAVAGRV